MFVDIFMFLLIAIVLFSICHSYCIYNICHSYCIYSPYSLYIFTIVIVYIHHSYCLLQLIFAGRDCYLIPEELYSYASTTKSLDLTFNCIKYLVYSLLLSKMNKTWFSGWLCPKTSTIYWNIRKIQSKLHLYTKPIAFCLYQLRYPISVKQSI